MAELGTCEKCKSKDNDSLTYDNHQRLVCNKCLFVFMKDQANTLRGRKSSGVELIAAERERQIAEEGWTAEHDDGWVFGQLAQAAWCYLSSSTKTAVPSKWPFMPHWWKPELSRKKELIKAGALIAAEIDRLNRLEESK